MASIGQTTRPGYVYDSATDTWIPIGIGPHTHTSTDLSGVIANSIVDAKGDLITATADNTPARLAVGANGQYLQADSSTATGLKWATVATNKSFTLLNTTTLNGASSYTVTGLSGYDQFYVQIVDCSSSASLFEVRCKINSDAANHFLYGGQVYNPSSTSGYLFRNSYNNFGYFEVVRGVTTAMAGIMIFGANATGPKPVQILSGASNATDVFGNFTMGHYNGSSVISEITISVSSGTFDAGTMRIFGAA